MITPNLLPLRFCAKIGPNLHHYRKFNVVSGWLLPLFAQCVLLLFRGVHAKFTERFVVCLIAFAKLLFLHCVSAQSKIHVPIYTFMVRLMLFLAGFCLCLLNV